MITFFKKIKTLFRNIFQILLQLNSENPDAQMHV